MKKDQFIEEMLDEVKNLKDLTKKEMPLIAQEYIRYNLIIYSIGAVLSLILCLLGVGAGLYGTFGNFRNNVDSNGFIFLGIVMGGLGMLFLLCAFSSVLAFKLQPRRMAIKAITSLRRRE